jgi:hypothetical protein
MFSKDASWARVRELCVLKMQKISNLYRLQNQSSWVRV